ncbi:MAG TPA: glycosyltransferase [Chloroflexia bacterium]|nr:glycosyltransferase [Chloroflexia bacterium]
MQTDAQRDQTEDNFGETTSLRVSVIIPCHNEEKHIGECLDSLLKQTIPAEQYELIVVDDGSSDRTVEIVRGYLRQNPGRLRFFQQNHAGPALARNFGAKQSHGKVLAFLDADMLFAPDFLEKLVAPVEAGEVTGTFTLDEFVANVDNLWSRSWNVCYYLPPDRRVPENLTEQEGTVFRAINRADFFKVGGYDSTGYHDDHTVAKKLGKTARRVDGAVCYHYNPGSAREVFASANWIGKSDGHPHTVKEWLRRTPPGSLKRGIARAIEEHEPFYIIFDQVYSFGILTGLFKRYVLKKDHSR